MAPLLPVALAFIVGILLKSAGGGVWPMVALITAAIVLLVCKRIYPAILSLCAVAGFFVALVRAPQPLPEECFERRHSWSGTVAEHREYEGAQMVIVKVDTCDGEACPSFMVKCLIPSMLPALDETDRMRFSARMQSLDSNTDLPDEDDYNAALRRLGIQAATVIEPDSVTVVVPESGVVYDIRRMRRDVQRLIACAPLDGDTRSFLIAALTGDRSWLAAETRELFSVTGIAHVLALSGLHVGVLTLVVTLMLFPFTGMAGGRYRRMTVTVVVLWIFAVMTGLSPSVVRAVVMATLFAGCTMLQRVWSPLNALGAAALLILLFAPEQVYTLGFMLTFLAVLSIIVFAGKINPFDYRHPWLRLLTGYLCVTVAAMLGTGMVCAYNFHIFPVGFLITNIAVSLLLPPLLGGGVVLLLLNVAGVRAAWLGGAVDSLMDLVQWVARGVAALPCATVDGLWLSGWMVGVYFVLLSLFALWLYRRRVVTLYAMGAIGVSAVVWGTMTYDRLPEHEAYIVRSVSETSMVVREGDSLYVHTTATRGRVDDVKARMERRCGGYMTRRGIDRLTVMADGMRSGRTAREDNLVVACGKSFVFVSQGSQVRNYAFAPSYAVVCRGFRGDVCALAMTVGADSVLLSRDLDRRRHDRYVRELTQAFIPHRSLRDAPLHVVGR